MNLPGAEEAVDPSPTITLPSPNLCQSEGEVRAAVHNLLVSETDGNADPIGHPGPERTGGVPTAAAGGPGCYVTPSINKARK